MQVAAAEFQAKFPDTAGDGKGSFTVVTLREMLIGDTRLLLWILLGAVGLVLLIACANVAKPSVGKSHRKEAGRSRSERLSAPARGRMIRQLLTESTMLSLAGGALGLLLGIQRNSGAALAVNTAGLPMVGDKGTAVEMDWRVAAFAFAVSLVTGIAFGLFPALQGSRVDLNSVLKDSSGRSGTGLKQNKARAALVVSEVGLAVVLLVGAALLIRTFVAMYRVERGFETKNVVTMRMSLTGPKFLKSADAANAIRSGAERVLALPGVLAATATCCIPLQGGYGLNFDVIGRPPAGPASNQEAGWAPIAAGFFDAFKIPVKRGRAFTDKDDQKSQPVVIINETMAKKYWKDSDPLKDRIVLGHGVMKEFNEEPARQIVGIVGDVRDQGLDNEPRPTAYLPQAQLPDVLNTWLVRQAPMAWVVRTQSEPHALIPAIQEQLRQATGLPVGDVPIHGRSSVAIRREAAVQHAADDGVRQLGAVAGGDRNLRVDGLYGGATDAGDRNPASAGRGGKPGPQHDRASGHGAGAGRGRHRNWGGVGAGAGDRKLSVWCEGSRSHCVRRHSGGIDRRGALGRLAARESSEPGESGGLTSLRVIQWGRSPTSPT